jgi:hypothetical protein
MRAGIRIHEVYWTATDYDLVFVNRNVCPADARDGTGLRDALKRVDPVA